jgi:membrane dipeptidase
LHVDSFIWSRVANYDLRRRHGRGLFGARMYGQVDLPRVLESGLTGATWSITTNPFRTAAGRVRTLVRNVERLSALLRSLDQFQVVKNAAEYRQARQANKHAAFLGVQGGNALECDARVLAELPTRLLLRVTLVHLTSSRLGTTSSPARLGADRGLSDSGRELVRALNQQRVFVDLAHISKQGFWDAVEIHDRSQPLLVSHTGVSTIHPHWRNLDDQQLRAVAETGGTIGVIFHTGFLGPWPRRIGAQAIVRHLEHIVNTVGEDHASLGSDWDGMILPPRDLPTCLELPRLTELMLQRGWKPGRIRKILGGNALRAIELLRG